MVKPVDGEQGQGVAVDLRSPGEVQNAIERARVFDQRVLLETRARRAAAVEQATRLSASARSLLDTAVPEAEHLTAIARASYAEGELDLVGLLDAYAAEADVIDQALQQQARALDAQLELELLAPVTPSQSEPSFEGTQP